MRSLPRLLPTRPRRRSPSLPPLLARALFALALLTLGALAAPPARAQTATFNFDAEAFGTATTFSETRSGDTATFSSPADPGGFTVFPSFFATLTGNVLIDNLLNASNSIPLTVTFSLPSHSLALNFAQNTTVASPFTADFYSGGLLVGSATAFGVPLGPSNSEGALSFSSSLLFNSVTFTSPHSTAFAVDNLRVEAIPAAVPEASTPVSLALLLALGLGAMLVAAKRQKAA